MAEADDENRDAQRRDGQDGQPPGDGDGDEARSPQEGDAAGGDRPGEPDAPDPNGEPNGEPDATDPHGPGESNDEAAGDVDAEGDQADPEDDDPHEYDYGEYHDDYDYEHGHDYDEAGDEDEDWEYEDDEEEEGEDEDDGEDGEDGQRKMTLVEHLDELRSRLIKVAVGLAVGMGTALVLSPRIIAILSRPFHVVVKDQGALVATAMMDPFMMYLKMSLYVGIIISCPWWFYQLWMFIAAGLYTHEKRYVRLAVPFSAGLFITGALFFLFVISEYLLTFFFVFSTEVMGIKPMITLKNHVTFMTNMMLVFGLCFQTPIAVLVLAKMGLVTTETLNRYRKHVIVGILIIAAVSTSPSPIDQIALAIPMWMLYELGVLLAYFLVTKKQREEDAAYERRRSEEE